MNSFKHFSLAALAAFLVAPASLVLSQAPAGGPTPQERRANMNERLATYEQQTEESTAAWRKAVDAVSATIDPAQARIDAILKAVTNDGREESLRNVADAGNTLCVEIKRVEKESDAYAVRAVDQAKACSAAMGAATAAAANCAGAAGADAIDASLNAAAQVATSMERDLAQLRRYRDLVADHLNRLVPLAQRQAQLVADIGSQISQASVEFQDVKALRAGPVARLPELERPLQRIQEIRKNVVEAAAYYKKEFPDSAGRWDALIARLAPFNFSDDAGGRLERFHKDCALLEKYFDFVRTSNYPASKQFPACGDAARLDTLLANATAEADLAKVQMFTTDGLRAKANACRQPPPGMPPAAPSQNPAQPQPPNLLGMPAPPDPPAGGIFIRGPARLSPGQSAVYRAVDGEGNEYTSGVQWNSSVEDVVIVGGSRGQAVAFKKGTTVVMAYHPSAGRSAFLNVIVDDEPGQTPAPVGDAAPGVPAAGGASAPHATPPTPSGFEALGGDTRQAVQATPSGESPIKLLDEFFQGNRSGGQAPAQDAEAIRREEEEYLRSQQAAANDAARRRQLEQERNDAAVEMLGVMAGMNQSMQDLRNRRQQPAPAVNPAPAAPPGTSTLSAAQRSLIEGMAAGQQGRGATPSPAAGGGSDAPPSEAEKRALSDQIRATYQRDWYPRWCPEKLTSYNSGCATRPMGARDELLRMVQSARSGSELTRVRQLLPCYSNCITVHGKNEKSSGECVTQCRVSIR